MGEGHRIIHSMAEVQGIRPEDVYAGIDSVISGRDEAYTVNTDCVRENDYHKLGLV
jgi:hypothetical protein